MGKGLLASYTLKVKLLYQYLPVLIILQELRTWLEANLEFGECFYSF